MPMDTCPGSSPTAQEDTKQEIKPKMSSGRRSSKPLMEKRRRARINDSLCQLKSLILEATNKDTSRHSKLEKADILEMTVKYLRNMQRCRMSGSTNNSADLNRYRLGYSECINEVSRFLDSSEPAMQLRTQLIGHLANRCSPPASPVSQQPPQAVAFTPSPSPAPIVATAAMVPQTSSHHSVQVQVAQRPQSVARGEIRVVLPPEALPNGQLPSHFIPVYTHSTPSPTSSTSSVETPPSPTRPSHSPAILQAHELSAPVSYEPHHGQHQQSVPLAYMQGVAPATSSPLVGSTAPSTVPSTTGQTPTLVSLSAANAQTTATELRIPAQASLVHQQNHYETVPQHHLFYQSSPQSEMKAENINVPQQCADESVWRPW